MSTPAPNSAQDLENIAGLERQVQERLETLPLTRSAPAIDASGRIIGDYAGHLESRVLRAGLYRRQPILIHAPQRLHRSRQFQAGMDGVAHLLTALPPELALEIAERVREIVLLPEIVLYDDSLLTHVYLPDRSVLAVYLYPCRLEHAAAMAYPERFQTAAGNPPTASGTGASLLGAVCRTLQATDPDLIRDRILKFLIPRALLKAGEAEAMREIHDRYRKLRID